MNKIIIDCSPDSIKTAVIDGKGLVEYITDSKTGGSIVGNIYAGIVKNILTNQFAFVDIGQGRNGFLFLSDKKEAHLYSHDKKLLIKKGDTILVQAVKDEYCEKGSYLTTQLSLSGRYCILIKTGLEGSNVAISKKIEDDAEKKRLRNIAEQLIPSGYELILRTNSSGSLPEIIESEINELLQKFSDIDRYWQYQKLPCVIFQEKNVIGRNLKDLFNEQTDEVVINDPEQFEEAKNFVSAYFPNAQDRIKLYSEQKSIFDFYDINSHIRKITNKKVWLNSGGFIIIERTEACYVIDVNSGKFSGKGNHEKSSLKLNIEACREIARQMRIRNLSGIIIVDFIDMKQIESKNALISEFSNELKKDRISANVVGMTSLGLMEVTRKKTREALY